MKVERQTVPPVFQPIVITLETAEEAVCMWVRLNVPDLDAVAKGYPSIPITSKDKLFRIVHSNTSIMWEKFDRTFDSPMIASVVKNLGQEVAN